MNITITAQKPVSEFLQVAQELITEIQEWVNVLWVRIVGCRPRFVSKKVIMSNLIQVAVSKEAVILDRNQSIAYVIRQNFAKKFNPINRDLRMIDYSSVDGEKIEQGSEEYKSVFAAYGWHLPYLEVHGEPYTCKYPVGY
jgi:hypothetical protein